MFSDLKNIKEQESTSASPAPKKKEDAQQHKVAVSAGQEAPKAVKKDSNKASKQASTIASKLASNHEELVENIRKTVRHKGKEVTFVRLSPEEKDQLGDMIYTFKRQGTKTTENEIVRIGLNYLIADYQANGEASVLAAVIAALNA
jgi:predicted RNase H-like nuclease